MQNNVDYDPKEYWEGRFANLPLGLSVVGYIGLGFLYNNWLYRTRFAALSRALVKTEIFTIGCTIFEGGVGSGAYVEYWQQHGAKTIFGADITETSINLLSQQYPKFSFYQRDLTSEHFNIPGSPFDIVTAQDVLFHITNDGAFSRAIQNLTKVLKPGGYLILSDGFCTQPWGPSFHEYHRSRSHYDRELSFAGLKIIHIEPIFFTMLPPLCGSQVLQKLAKVEIRMIKKINSIQWLMWLTNLIGFTLSMTDTMLGNILQNGPSLKFLIAQKENQNPGSREHQS